ncbi:MAG: M20/M25/M40 family metallo-hydrolase [Melioribacteraceae bacterium]|nr:M20/M25/M40 family metallo-hydrolase [Melioribacteraceae bacterium]
MKHQRIIQIFLELIKINALSSNEKPVADFIAEFLQNLDQNYYIDKSENETHSNTGNVVCKIGSGGSTLLSSHMDTARSTENVNPLIKDGVITSDGTTVLGVDNRAGVAILLALIESIKKNNLNTIDFTLAFTTCEETTIAGSKYLQIDDKIIEAFVFDSYMRPGRFVNRSSGAVTFRTSFIGKAAHAGIEPEEGINAISIAAQAIAAIEQGRINNHTSVNIGNIQGGSGVNVVPEEVTIEGEIRSTNKEEILERLLEIEKIFREIAEDFGGCLNFSHSWDFEPFEIKSDSVIYSKLHEAMVNVGLNFQPVRSMGGSDANSYNARNIEAINLGIGAQNPHSNDEFILVEDLIKSYELALEIVKK